MSLLLALPLPRVFLKQPLTVQIRPTGQAVHAINQSIFLRCLWLIYIGKVSRQKCQRQQQTIYLPWAPWAVRHRKDNFYFNLSATGLYVFSNFANFLYMNLCYFGKRKNCRNKYFQSCYLFIWQQWYWSWLLILILKDVHSSKGPCIGFVHTTYDSRWWV